MLALLENYIRRRIFQEVMCLDLDSTQYSAPPEAKRLCFLLFERYLVRMLFYTSGGGGGQGSGAGTALFVFYRSV
jgi:hypothetical protein